MCGIGKFMVVWKERETADCPWCREFEDTAHIWRCSGQNASDLWDSALDRLENWMQEQQTDPDIQDSVL